MLEGVTTIPIPAQPPAYGSAPGELRSSSALGEFFAGPENRLVEPAVQGILCRNPTPYNPLVLYGPSGTGKSHLARGLAAAWKATFPASRVAYTTSVDFARDLAEAIESQAVEDFDARYREVDLAVFENIGELVGKPAAQEDLISTLDALIHQGGQVVATASVAPAELTGLAPNLQARLSEGLTVPLAPPGREVRRIILQQWAKGREFHMSDSILQLLANGLDGTVPELLGAMLQLETPARADGRALDVQAVRGFLAERDLARRPQLREIAVATARHFSLKLADLRGPSRRRPVVVARDVAMFLGRTLTKESLEQVGQYFGGRDHTTVMHACRKTEELQRSDPEIRQAMDQLQRRFQG